MLTLPPNLTDRLAGALRHSQQTVEALTRQLDSFGYLPIDTPLIEQADYFLIKAGDAAINRLVSFELNGQTLCLRPEFTAPAARVYIERFQDHPGPVRLQFAGPILQYDNSGHGAIIEQIAVGAELINEYSAAADAEVIALAIRLLESAGVTDWRLSIGHSGLIERFLDRYQLSRQMRRFVIAHLPVLRQGAAGLRQTLEILAGQEQANRQAAQPVNNSLDAEAALYALLQAMPQHGPTGGRTREEIAHRLLDKQQRGDQHDRARHALQDLQRLLENAVSPAALLASLDNDLLQPIAQHVVDTFDLLAFHGLPDDRIAFDLSFTRSLDYYTGLVFECYLDGAEDVLLGGGGRYDELIGLLGARRTVPAVGFMLYITPILDARQRSGVSQATSDRVHVLLQAAEDALAGDTITLATALRAAGIHVTAHHGPLPPAGPPFGETHLLTAGSSTLRLERLADHTSVTLDRDDLAGLLRALETRP